MTREDDRLRIRLLGGFRVLHVARRVLEPALGRGSDSRFLRRRGESIALVAEAGLEVDALVFEAAAKRVLEEDAAADCCCARRSASRRTGGSRPRSTFIDAFSPSIAATRKPTAARCGPTRGSVGA